MKDSLSFLSIQIYIFLVFSSVYSSFPHSLIILFLQTLFSFLLYLLPVQLYFPHLLRIFVLHFSSHFSALYTLVLVPLLHKSEHHTPAFLLSAYPPHKQQKHIYTSFLLLFQICRNAFLSSHPVLPLSIAYYIQSHFSVVHFSSHFP